MKRLVLCSLLAALAGCASMNEKHAQPTLSKAVGTEVRVNFELWPRGWVISENRGDYPGIAALSPSTGCRQLLFFSQDPRSTWSSISLQVSSYPGIESACTGYRPHRLYPDDEVVARFLRSVNGRDYVVRIQGFVFGEMPEEPMMIHVLECPIESERHLENVAQSVIDSVSVCAPD